MASRKTGKGKIIILLLLLFTAVFACIAIYAMYSAQAVTAAELDSALRKSDMELSVRLAAAGLRTEREAEALRTQENEASLRAQLKTQFLRRDRDDLLALVNIWNPLDEDFEPRVTDIGDGLLFDERGADALSRMLKDCYAAWNTNPVPISAYRTQAYQQGLFENKLERVLKNGTDPAVAEDVAAESVARPGTSEHQLGLAVDITDRFYTDLDIRQQWTGTQRWLMEHCWDYGFILRYPEGTTELTGIIFEPWHYRYVGVQVAQEIHERGITLEEYLTEG